MLLGLPGSLLLPGGHRWLPSWSTFSLLARRDLLYGLALWHDSDLHKRSLEMPITARSRSWPYVDMAVSVAELGGSHVGVIVMQTWTVAPTPTDRRRTARTPAESSVPDPAAAQPRFRCGPRSPR